MASGLLAFIGAILLFYSASDHEAPETAENGDRISIDFGVGEPQSAERAESAPSKGSQAEDMVTKTESAMLPEPTEVTETEMLVPQAEVAALSTPQRLVKKQETAPEATSEGLAKSEETPANSNTEPQVAIHEPQQAEQQSEPSEVPSDVEASKAPDSEVSSELSSDIQTAQPDEAAGLNQEPDSPQMAPGVTQPSTTSSPKIARAQFTSGIAGREPIDRVESVVRADQRRPKRLYYFTEFRDMEGETVTHRWEHEGKVAAEITFEVRGNRWRAYSSKSLLPTMTGQWRVVVTDSAGKPLSVASFAYQ